MKVSPCDGRVLSCGQLANEQIEQVKGITYKLGDFLGQPCPVSVSQNLSPTSTKTQSQNKININSTSGEVSTICQQGNSLYHCTIYLSPADCHVFYSPTDWSMNDGRHFPG